VDSGPEAPFAFVDDAVSACSRAWIDAEDSHGERLGGRPDSPSTHARQPATVALVDGLPAHAERAADVCPREAVSTRVLDVKPLQVVEPHPQDRDRPQSAGRFAGPGDDAGQIDDVRALPGVNHG
jgi:hypothetical protein